MLESLAKRFVASQDVLRLANLSHIAVFATKKGLTLEQTTDVIAFTRDDVTKELMESPFQRKPNLNNKFAPASRFSNGDWPVFYAAIDRETAVQESSHHYGSKAAGDPAARRRVHYSIVRCVYREEIIDLQVKLADWPDLVSENYEFCNELGREAHGMSLGAFFAPSARHQRGTTVPAFVPHALSDPIILSTVQLSYAGGGTVVETKDLPTA